MQNSILDIAHELEGSDQIDSHISFRGFINFLKERRLNEKTFRIKYLDFVIHHFEHRLDGKEVIEQDELQQYGDLLELIYATIFPAIEDERDNLWALAVPIKPTMFYGTDTFYDFLRDPASCEPRACMIDKTEKVRKKINFELVYSTILRRLYGYSYTPASTFVRSLRNEVTGLLHYFRLNIDTRFIEVFPKGVLPEIDLSLIKAHPAAPETLSYLMERLPLNGFRYEGFSAITVTDVTADYVVESIKNIILNPAHCDSEFHQEEVIRNLKILAGKSELDFGLVPFLRINGKPVFSDEICQYSILAEAAISNKEAEDTYLAMVEEYYADPRQILYETLPAALPGESFYLETLRRDGILSYGMLPVYYNNRPAGVLEISSRTAGAVSSALLSKLDLVIPLLAQLLQRSIDEFEDRIKDIIKENFTSIQPAVEWKFNEVAWHYERMREMGEPIPVLETIYFKEVYPLYGAIDIRNSTIERNNALRSDLQTQFRILIKTLMDLKERVSLDLLDDILFQCTKWQTALSRTLTTAEELDLNAFLKEKIDVFFSHFKDSRPDTSGVIAPYLQAIDEADGVAYRHRRDLERSVQLINQTINKHLATATDELQKPYPTYFETFRTDGIEYDIYIGQSIAPERPFDLLYLRNLRLWQLNAMAVIARQTHALLEKMPDKLSTTQLIFVHSGPIDISFRKDERRFDVEGGYNIRYQVVKKRIDKVHVKDTNERLTQPGKIAIIYFNDKEAEEYTGYIKYLQEKDVFTEEIEDMELEELQGVSGLRALRVELKW
ncbi:MAG TPA: GAF domain-containing protein [Puia sp.]|jgi:hypothetical protein